MPIYHLNKVRKDIYIIGHLLNLKYTPLIWLTISLTFKLF